jgi:hypothetical protein
VLKVIENVGENREGERATDGQLFKSLSNLSG